MSQVHQLDFGWSTSPEPAKRRLLLSIQEEYYLLIKRGVKRYEYRRRFADYPSTAFLYVNAPVSAILGKVELGAPIFGPVDEICRIAEEQQRGSTAAMKQYLAGLSKGYAIPILSFTEVRPIPVLDLRQVYAKFAPPQLYLVLDNNPALLSFILERTS